MTKTLTGYNVLFYVKMS